MSNYGETGNNNQIRTYAHEKNPTIIDLRSDSLSKPSMAMRQAMFNADIGGGTYEVHPSITELEEKAASLLGKEAAIFVTTGTMGNLIAIMIHCEERGSQAYCGDESHVFSYEQGAAAQIAGVTLSAVPNNQDGTFDLKMVEQRLSHSYLHEAFSKLILIENTFNGKILPQSWIDEVTIFANEHNLKLHMDGARLWNASIGSNVLVKEIVRSFDSVTFCLGKGLGAPGGAILCGSKSFIRKAWRIRKALGGGTKQADALGAAGLVALEETIPMLKDDHRRAFWIARSISELESEVFKVDLKTTATNIVLVNINSEKTTAQDFVGRLETILDDVEDDKTIVRCLVLSAHLVRIALYRDINDKAVKRAIQKISHVIKELDDKSKF